MTEYNGWYNYETWLVALWLGNDEGLYATSRDMAKNSLEWDHSAYRLQYALKELIEENMPEVSGLYGDLIRGALGVVVWKDIANHLIEEVSQEV